MLRTRIYLLLAIARVLACPHGPASAQEPSDLCDPKPAKGDLAIPLPGGQRLVFRPIIVGDDKGAFSAKTYKIGDRAEGGFQEFPTDISVAGSVLVQEAGTAKWAYYLGKYELSEAQYCAVMDSGTPERKTSAYPVRSLSWFEATAFLDKLNQWLFANAREKLPAYRGRPCFVRLPSEAEWEFAARGGTLVSPNEFDRKHPYTQPLAKHEWYSGAESSQGKVKRIGRLAPNILGIHDMLGNVSEMTSSAYSVEYYQGRVGGITVRGGSVLTLKDDMRSSYRNELPLYGQDLAPARQDTLGLRLALASQIFTDPHAMAVMEKEWEGYRKGRVVPTLASPTSPNAAAATASRVDEVQAKLSELQQMAASLPPDAANLIGLAAGAAQNIQADIAQSHKRLALASSKDLYRAAMVWSQSLLVMHISLGDRKSDPSAAGQALYEKKREIAEADLALSRENYGESLRNLGTLDPVVVTEAFAVIEERIRNIPAGHNADASLKVLGFMKKHYQVFHTTTQRVDIDAYTKDFDTVHAKELR